MKGMLRVLCSLLLALFVVLGGVIPRVHAANITAMQDVLSRSRVGVLANQTIKATMPTALVSEGNVLEILIPNGFTMPALALTDLSFTYGPSTGLENTVILAASPGTNIWGFAQDVTRLRFTVPTNAGVAGLPAGSKIIISIGTHVVGGSSQITNPSTPGLYRYIIQTPFESGNFFVRILASDTISVTATVPSSGSGGGGGGGGGGASAAGDPTAPPTPTLTVSNVRVENIRWNEATVTWETSANANRQVEYGETLSYGGLRAEGTPLTREHRMTITGLLPERTYYVRVRSQTPSEVVGTGTISFRTTAIPRAPVISNARITSITDRGAIVLFDTDIEAIGTVTIIPVTPAGGSTQTLTEVALARSHAVTVTGLRAGAEYTVKIWARESTGLLSETTTRTFRTTEDRTAPPNPFNISSFGYVRAIKVLWSNPPLEEGDSIIVRASTVSPPTSPTEGRLVYTGTGTDVLDTGLLDDTIYYYTLFAVDPSGNASSGAITSARTEHSRDLESEPAPPPEPSAEDSGDTEPPIRPASPSGDTGARRGERGPSGTSPSEAVTLRPLEVSPIGDQVSERRGPSTPVAPFPLTGVSPATAPVTVLTPLDADARTDGPTEGERDVRAFEDQLQTHVYVASGALELLSLQGVRTVLPSRPLLFRISSQPGSQTPTGGQLRVGESLYLLTGRAGDLGWETTVMSPAEVRDTSYEALFQYEDGSRRRETGTIRTRPLGLIREGALRQRDRTPVIPGAAIEILRTDGSLWASGPFQVPNPATTAEDGTYGFMVPQGTYRLRVSKSGFRTMERTVDVRDQVLAVSLTLTKELRPLATLLNADASVGENAAALLEQVGIATQILRDISETAEVQDATKSVVAPTAAVASVAVTATAVSSASALNYVRFLFTQPLLLIRRRRRNKWGTVYNALSKQPIELVIVRLVHAGSGVVIQTRITDAQGRFSFLAPPGQFRVQVLKASYVYPSVYLKGEKEDGDFVDLYHGEVITAKEGALLTPNIPVDPVVREVPPMKILWQGRLRRLQTIVSAGGTAISIGAFAIAPSFLTGGLFGVQLISYFLFRRLALPPKPKDWGIAYDTDSKQPLEKVIIRVFDKKFNKLLETQITDQKGKYGFFAGKGLYYITAEKLGYGKYTSTDIDLRRAKETVIDQKVGLVKEKKSA